jgi:TraX protein.
MSETKPLKQTDSTETKKKFSISFSTNILKIIAIISMTLDHIGYVMTNLYPDINTRYVAYAFRIVGRIALPLIIFILIEGLSKTKNIKAYLLRLGISCIVIYFGFILVQAFFDTSLNFEGNIFITLFLLSLSYYFLFKSKHQWMVIIPIAYFLLSYGLMMPFFMKYYIPQEFSFFIYLNGLYCQYTLLAPLLFFTTLLAYKIYDKKIAKTLAGDEKLIEEFKSTKDYQRSKNILASIIIVIFSLICYLVTYLPNYEGSISGVIDFALLTYMILACLFILFYSGKRGFKTKITQYGFYIYYPLHIVIIIFVFWLIYHY